MIPSSGVDCGLYDGCVIFDTESTSLLGVATCTLPAVSPYAALYIDTDTGYNLPDPDCHGIGSDYHPTFVLVLDSSVPSGAYTHIQRHEVGHALGLNDTSTSCYTENSTYYPLMNNGTSGTCSNYPNNITATSNEIQGVISRNSWF